MVLLAIDITKNGIHTQVWILLLGAKNEQSYLYLLFHFVANAIEPLLTKFNNTKFPM